MLSSEEKYFFYFLSSILKRKSLQKENIKKYLSINKVKILLSCPNNVIKYSYRDIEF